MKIKLCISFITIFIEMKIKKSNYIIHFLFKKLLISHEMIYNVITN
jgi:hypothetical protein